MLFALLREEWAPRSDAAPTGFGRRWHACCLQSLWKCQEHGRRSLGKPRSRAHFATELGTVSRNATAQSETPHDLIKEIRDEPRACAIAPTPPKSPSPLYKSLFVQVVVALVLGIVLGMATPDFAIGLKFFSDAFLKLISMIVAPIVFCVVVHGIAGAGDLKKVGRVGGKALVYFEVMTTVALVVGLVARPTLFAPGDGHEHRTSPARRARAQHLRRQCPQAAGRRHRRLRAQHHPHHLVRRAGAQRRAAGAVLRHPVRRQPGAGRRARRNR